MISEELKQIVDVLLAQGEMSFLDGASEDQIQSFESDHSFVLPQLYKEWLLFSDGGELFPPAGIQLYGVSHKPIIDVNDNDRPNENYIVIGALSTGDPILCEKNTERISIYNHEAGKIEDDESYEDFHAFLNDVFDSLGIGD